MMTDFESTPLEPQFTTPLDPTDRNFDFDLLELLRILDDDIRAVAHAWDALDNSKLTALVDRVPEAVAADAEFYHEATVHNREHQRSETMPDLRDMRNYFGTKITHAQHIAYLLEFDKSERQTKAQENIDALETIVKQDELLEGLEPSDMIVARVVLDVINHYRPAIRLEVNLLDKISEWLDVNIDHLQELTEWIISSSTSTDNALLQSLASHHCHKKLPSIFKDYFTRMSDNPNLYQHTYLKFLISEANSPDSHDIDPDLGWLHYLSSSEEGNKIIEQLYNAPLEQLPVGIAKKITDSHREYVASLSKRLDQALKPHDQPDHHLIFEFNPTPKPTNRKQPARKRRGSRTTTPPNNLDAISGLEARLTSKPVQQITTVMHLKQVSGGLSVEPLQAEGETPLKALLNSDPVTSYLSHYKSVTELKESVQSMLKSILITPKGHGAEKMNDQTANITVGGVSHKLPIWHLNPCKRPNLPLSNMIAKHTRIFYCLFPQSDGDEILILKEIKHKNTLAK